MLNEAFRVRMKELSSKPLTAEACLRMEQMARLARETLATDTDPQAMVKRVRKTGASPVLNLNELYNNEDNGTFQPPTTAAENFATTLMKEIVPVLTQLTAPKPAVPVVEPINPMMQVLAIAEAKKAGLNDLAERLQNQLIVQGSSALCKLNPFVGAKFPPLPALVEAAKPSPKSKGPKT